MPLIICLSLLCAVASALLAHYVLGRVHRLRLREVESAFTAELRELEERAQAYEQLEGQACQATAEFDRLEREFVEQLTQQNQHVQELEQALDAYQGRPSVERGPSEVLSVEEVGVEDGDAASGDAVEALIAWREKVGRLQESKRAELEQQSHVIARLTARVRGLESPAPHQAQRAADAEAPAAAPAAEQALRVDDVQADECAEPSEHAEANGVAAAAERVASPGTSHPARTSPEADLAEPLGPDTLRGEFHGALRTVLRLGRELERGAAAAAAAGAEQQRRCAALEDQQQRQESAQHYLKTALEQVRGELGAEVVRAADEARSAAAARRALEAELAAEREALAQANDRARAEGERARAEGERARTEGERARAEGERARICDSLIQDGQRELAAREARSAELERELAAARAELASLRADGARRAAELGAASAVLSELKPMIDSLASHLGNEAKAA